MESELTCSLINIAKTSPVGMSYYTKNLDDNARRIIICEKNNFGDVLVDINYVNNLGDEVFLNRRGEYVTKENLTFKDNLKYFFEEARETLESMVNPLN